MNSLTGINTSSNDQFIPQTETLTYPSPDQQKYLLETPGFVRSGSHWPEFFALIIGLIFVVLIVLLAVVFPHPDGTVIEVANITITEDNNLANDTTGASVDGLVNVNNGTELQDQSTCLLKSSRNWIGGCQCRNPFYGSQCDLESYSSHYTNIGTPDPQNITSSLSDRIPVDRLSFPLSEIGSAFASGQDINPTPTEVQTSIMCTDLCDHDVNCQGVWWTPAPGNNFGIGIDINHSVEPSMTGKPLCQLLNSPAVVVPGSTLPYSPEVQGTLYLKSTTDPHFKDRVFVYMGTKPVRYWLTPVYIGSTGNQLRSMFDSQLVKFNWTPTNIINNTGTRSGESPTDDNPPWYGFFSDRSFDPSDVTLTNQLAMLSQSTRNSNPIDYQGQQFVIASPTDDTLKIPAGWQELWGLFRPITLSTNSNGIEVPRATLTEYETFSGTSDTSTSTMYSLFDTTETCDELVPTVHDVRWDKERFPTDGSAMTIRISKGDRLRIVSTENCYHDLVSTDSRWFIINTPFNIGTSRPFRANLDFNRSGTYYMKDRNNPFQIRLIVVVT